MFAISVDGTMYTFCHSPLGLLSANVQWIPDVAPLDSGVHLYERRETWVAIQWPAHLWWTRFLLVGHNHFAGTRYEGTCHYNVTSRFLAWWLCRTTVTERCRFFKNPNVTSLLRRIRRHTSAARHSWLHGHSGAIHSLRRVHIAIKKHYPLVLRPCSDQTSSEQWQYSSTRSAHMVKELLHTMEQRTMVTAFLIPFRSFEQELLSRYGCLMSEAIDAKQGQMVEVPYPLVGASIRRYRELGCSILDFQSDRFIALCTVEQMWNNFAGSLCRLMQRAQVILLDAPIPTRRRIHIALHGALSKGCCWVVDSVATITNLQEEVGVDADTAKHMRLGNHNCLVIDGMHRMSLRQQADLLHEAATHNSIRMVILGGDTTGKGMARGRALDGWTLCCHAVQLNGGCTTNVNQVGLSALQAELTMLLRCPCPRLMVWTVEPSSNTDEHIDFEQCSAVDAAPVNECKRRWLCAPVPNCHLVSWVCSNITIPKGTMLVVNWEADCRTVASQQRKQQSLTGVKGFTLCDQTEPYISQDVRCVGTLRGRMRAGEVLRVVGPSQNDATLVLQRLSVGGFVQVTKEELRTTCRPARLSPLYEQLNSHYARRHVIVVLSHTSSHGPAMRQEWDPLYTGLGLGGVKNVTIVANQQGLDAARRRMKEVLDCKAPEIPLIWQQFVLALVNTGVVKNTSP